MSRDRGFTTSCRKGAVLCFISLFNFFLKDAFIYFWLFRVFIVLWAFSGCSECRLLLVTTCRLLAAVASLVEEHRIQAHRLSSYSTWASLLCSLWGLPCPGIKPLSLALAGRFLTSGTSGKPLPF